MGLMKRYLLFILLSLVLLLPSGCVSNLQADYVAADEETYNLVKPVVVEWSGLAPGVSDQQRLDWELKLRSWEFRIQQAKRLLAEEAKDQ